MVTQLEVQALGGGAGGGAGQIGHTAPSWGQGGAGGNYVDAIFLPSAFSFPVSVVIGSGGVGATDTNSGFYSGANGTDTYLGVSINNCYVYAYGGQPSPPNSIANGAQSYTTEKGGQNGVTPNTTNAGGAGAGGGTGHETWSAAGSSSSGPGGTGGSSPSSGPSDTGGVGGNYGAGGGAGAHFSTGAGAGGNGAPGVMVIIASYPGTATGFNVYRNGVLIGNTTTEQWTDSPPSGSQTYKVVAVYGQIEAAQGAETVTVQISVPPEEAYGKFVGSPVFKAVEISRVGDVIPRIWPAKKNNTVQA